MSGIVRSAFAHRLFKVAAPAILFVPIMAHANSNITIFNGNGGSAGTPTGGVNGPFSLTSSVTAIGIFAQAPGATLSFTTGQYIGGGNLYGSAHAGGAQPAYWSPGAAGSFTVTGSWNGYTGTIFTGEFSAPVSWLSDGCTGPSSNETCHYTLTGPISGSWINGTQVKGQSVSILFIFTGKAVCTGCGNYNGGKITDLGGTTGITTPEPNSLGLMGAGLLSLGFAVKRKLRAVFFA